MSDGTFEAFMSRKMSSSSRKGGLYIICCLLSFALLPIYNATDTITLNQNITDGKTLVSSGKVFELGFFSPDKKSPTKATYLGMWYHGIEPQTVVWVANRDQPVTDYPGVFAMTDDGDLQVIDGKRSVLWSALKLIPEDYVSLTAAVLQNDGNLVLKNDTGIVWKSFSDVSDTLLPGMNMEKKILRSWKNNSNPALGEFTFSLSSSTGRSRFEVWRNRSYLHWMSGWSDMSIFFNDLHDNLNMFMLPNHTVKNTDAKFILPNHTFTDTKFRLVMNSSGQIEFLRWDSENNGWLSDWTEPEDACSFYNICGNYGVCSSGNNSKLKCECLPGFVPNSVPQWKSGNYSSGCMREITDCNTEYDNFENVSLGKVGNPDNYFPAINAEECGEECKSICCNAYMFDIDRRRVEDDLSTCYIWSSTETLNDLSSNFTSGLNPWIRVAASDLVSCHSSISCIPQEHTCSSLKDCKQWPNTTCELNAGRDERKTCICVPNFSWNSTVRNCVPVTDNGGSTQNVKRPPWTLLLGITGGVALIAFATIGIGCLWRVAVGRKSQRNTLDGKSMVQNEESIDVPFYDFEIIVAATNNFSLSNKLGQGGFGPVYKGNFSGGQEVAVKRLSRSSGQGLEEFKNEVVLIAKLQHRNLVRLVGYCMKGEDEKMLIYEYMPNRSLDSIVFDQEKRVLLNWEMRYNIILGVARGLLYLHHDSRLRIIHRDLKTSNILLDEEMNPKISDFGMARIFGGKQIEANTDRVVGTYGYMSPEYAIDGLFSIKSDVFSFGIIVLEIISGKKNKLFYHEEQALPLLGYAWKLWNEDTGLDLMDGFLREDCDHGQALKCIQVALLCVQDNAVDRPTMSEVMSLLSSEAAVVPCPKQPAFVVKRFLESIPSSSSSSKQAAYSGYELTITFEGR